MTRSVTRRTLLMSAAAAPLAAGLAGCGGGTDANDLKTITTMIPLLEGQAPDPKGAEQQGVEKFIDKKLDISWVSNSDYNDKTTVTLASNNIPEIMVIQGKVPAFIQAAQAGAFWELTDKLGKYPNLVAQNKQIQLAASVNGKIFGIFRLRDPMRTAVILRKDWLDRLNLDVPETVEDLYNVAKAFTEGDPNGDGKKDTYGLIIPKWPAGYATASPYDVIETWFGAPNGWGVVDGKLKPGFDTPEFLKANQFVQKMINEGLVNPDFATLDSGSWNDPFFDGKGGIIIDVSSRGLDMLTLFREKYPDSYGDYVTMTGNLLGPDGKRHSYPTIGYNGFLSISKQSVPTEDELDDILSVLDKLSSKPGQILLNDGFEGKNFKVQGGYAVAIDPDSAANKVIQNDVTSFAQLGTQANGYLAYLSNPGGAPDIALDKLRTRFHARDMKTAVYDPALALVSDTYTQKGAELDQIIADARIKFLAGQIDEKGLQSEIDRWYSEGGQQVVKEMNELYPKVY